MVKRQEKRVIVEGITKNPCKGFLLLSVLLTSFVYGHPHVFVDNSVALVFGQKGLDGIKVKWIFDEMFSATIIHDYDENDDGAFDGMEMEKLKMEAFSNLENFHYFVYITVGRDNIPVKSVSNFLANIEQDRVIYSFFVPCLVRHDSTEKKVKIAVYDSTYFIDVGWVEKNPVQVVNPSFVDFSYSIKKRKNKPIYFGFIYPKELICIFRIAFNP